MNSEEYKQIKLFKTLTVVLGIISFVLTSALYISHAKVRELEETIDEGPKFEMFDDSMPFGPGMGKGRGEVVMLEGGLIDPDTGEVNEDMVDDLSSKFGGRLPSFLESDFKKELDDAVADGILTQEEADDVWSQISY